MEYGHIREEFVPAQATQIITSRFPETERQMSIYLFADTARNSYDAVSVELDDEGKLRRMRIASAPMQVGVAEEMFSELLLP